MGDFVLITPLINSLRLRELNVYVSCNRNLTKELSSFIIGDDFVYEYSKNINIDLIIFTLGCSPSNLNILLNFFFTKSIGFINSNRIKSNFVNFFSVDYSFENHIYSNLKILDLLKYDSVVKEYLQLKNSNSRSEKLTITVNLKSKGFTRNWPLNNYIELIKKINLHYNMVTINLIGGVEDIDQANFVKENISSSSIMNYCDKLSIANTIDVIFNSDLLITGDSGIMHLGFTSGVKTLALFGPTNFQKYILNHSNKYFISMNPQFCYFGVSKRSCNCDHNDTCVYLKKVNSDLVFQKVKEILQ